jgi:hypothetical protein
MEQWLEVANNAKPSFEVPPEKFGLKRRAGQPPKID